MFFFVKKSPLILHIQYPRHVSAKYMDGLPNDPPVARLMTIRHHYTWMHTSNQYLPKQIYSINSTVVQIFKDCVISFIIFSHLLKKARPQGIVLLQVAVKLRKVLGRACLVLMQRCKISSFKLPVLVFFWSHVVRYCSDV